MSKIVPILIQSRESAEKYAPDDPHVLVSISTPKIRYPKEPLLTENTLAVARLFFHDLDHEPGPSYVKTYGKPELFSKRYAKKLADFLLKNCSPEILLRVHCDAGISRSAAVAAAWANFNGDRDTDIAIFDIKSPNMLVYKMLLEVLHGAEKNFYY